MKKKPRKKKQVSHLEIERKFILKNLPEDVFQNYKFKKLFIAQYYFLINGVWERFRKVDPFSGNKPYYVHTIKTKISKGVYDEMEQKISEKVFQKAMTENKALGTPKKVIHKIRYVVSYKGLKFEIDQYSRIHLLVLEVELPDMKFPIVYPPGLEKYIIGEITGVRGFSNLSMAEGY